MENMLTQAFSPGLGVGQERQDISEFVGWTKAQPIRSPRLMDTVVRREIQLLSVTLIRIGIFGRICKSDQVRE